MKTPPPRGPMVSSEPRKGSPLSRGEGRGALRAAGARKHGGKGGDRDHAEPGDPDDVGVRGGIPGPERT